MKWQILVFLASLAMNSAAQTSQYTAVNDTTTTLCFKEKIVDVLANDQYPPGTDIEIRLPSNYYLTVTSDNKIKLSPSTGNFAAAISFPYFFRNKLDTTQFSDTAFLTVFFTINTDSIQAVADTLVFENTGPALYFDPTLNDIDPIPGDSLSVYILSVQSPNTIKCEPTFSASRNLYKITPSLYCQPGTYYGQSIVKRKKYNLPMFRATTEFVVIIKNNSTFRLLDTNNIRARINGYGNQFLDFIKGGVFEAPKGSGKGTLFSSALWIGGKDDAGLLHLAAERYRQGPGYAMGTEPDYYCGPVMDSVWYQKEWDTAWDRVWKVTRAEVEYHRNHWWEANYVCPEAILNWPGNGDSGKGQAAMLAPYSDRGNDGHYNAMDGDFPVIRGDMAIFFIFNDDRGKHFETRGRKLKAEFQGMAYSFVCPGDTAVNNSIFFHYDIFNRSTETYHETSLGIFADLDIGYVHDDYAICDVERNSIIGYNGKRIDGTGQPNEYGNTPPAQSVTILAGATIDPDGLDNPRYDDAGHQLCNESINGLNFGYSIADNERFGMTRFMHFLERSTSLPPHPIQYASDHYLMLQGFWSDSTALSYGDEGHMGTGAYGPACRFQFPGLSDTLDWGTGCLPPNGPKLWTAEAALMNPYEIRDLGITGPFTFHPGDKQELDVAYIFAQNMTGDSLASVSDLRRYISHIQDCFVKDAAPCGKTFSGIENHGTDKYQELRIWPNPAGSYVNIGYLSQSTCRYQITNLYGTVVQQGILEPGQSKHTLSLEIPAGFYLMTIFDRNLKITGKLVIIQP